MAKPLTMEFDQAVFVIALIILLWFSILRKGIVGRKRKIAYKFQVSLTSVYMSPYVDGIWPDTAWNMATPTQATEHKLWNLKKYLW